MPDEGRVHLARDGYVATVTFDRQHARNALTWAMYDQFHDHLEKVDNDADVRVVVLRGAGEDAFVAGTDIRQFQAFGGGEDGIAYNRRMDRVLARLEAVSAPTIAVGVGYVVGGGLAIASTCDLRICSEGSRFGIPVARTLGNLPTMSNLTRLAVLVGPARLKEMLLTARLWNADEALAAGLVHEVHPREALDARVEELCEILGHRAPITIRTVKEAMRRIVDGLVPDGDDLTREVYGSADFREGMTAFVEKREPQWRNE
ncbi:MAG: enoyl-CoA hydratase [Nitriliruptorales bacterium]|nr:enoyl-CoA hydratase [Nitriliruptorales bacterium]